jgi:16S rRNA (cytosine967-C5)-methyltransferase
LKTPRRIAADALLRVETAGGYSQLVLNGALQREKTDRRDAALVSALFYGCLERRFTLDHCIAAYVRRPADPRVRQILRIALYQLLYMDSIPASAAVSEAVEECRRMGAGSASGFVNGVLRAFIRAGRAIPPADGTAAMELAVRYSCAPALAAVLLDWYGPAAGDILAASLGRPPAYIRVNTLRTDSPGLRARLAEEGIAAEETEIPGALVCPGGDLAAATAFKEGLFHVQDLSAQQAVQALDPLPGERMLDVCAAPGGKSFTAAQRMENRGRIVACDLSASRLSLIGKGAARLGVGIVETRRQDALAFEPELGLFDRILCDVPCSGLGVMRRKPEIKYKNPGDFAPLPALQYKILETSAQYLKRGGVLVYATCTLNPQENGDVVRRLLEAHPEFDCDGQAASPGRTILPGEAGGDGFYIARLSRSRG